MDLAVPILLGFTLFFFVLFLLWSSAKLTFSSTTTLSPVLVACQPGQCLVNPNGEKICDPNISATLLSDPRYQVCSAPYVCEAPTLPYAIQNDQSTDVSGQCPAGVTCRCVARPQCSEFIVTAFSTINGSAYSDFSTNRVTFVQNNNYSNLAGGSSSVPPIIVSSPGTTFCQVPMTWLPRSSPGCVSVGAVTPNNIAQCMFNDNPCLVGTLAFVPTDPDNFSLSRFSSTPLAYVRGSKCPSGHVAYWHQQLGKVVCLAS